jgi:transcriptional regulator with XRE-family HTH domain
MVKYKKIGLLLKKLREKEGISLQSDWAKQINVQQQTVSRWENGTSRPTQKKLTEIAELFSFDITELLHLAGYDSEFAMEVVSFDKPFPVDALSPDSFERFCFFFLNHIHPDAKVHRAGGQGHTQEGLDIDALFDDGTCYTYQCKREKQFGPSKVIGVVKSHVRFANRKYLLLSRVASPKARDEIKKYSDWDIWDKEDISLEIRKLSFEIQKRLVRTFFPGLEQSLLGDIELSTLQTIDEYFAPFNGTDLIFNHSWDCVGRSDLISELTKAISSTPRVNVITGSGGIGKTKLLKQVTEKLDRKTVRFISPTEEITQKVLNEIDNKAILFIVDDAHERTDLDILLSYVASRDDSIKLLIATRPYGLSYIKSRITRFGMVIHQDQIFNIPRLTKIEAEELSTQVIKSRNGDISLAERIASLTFDCTLATVLASRFVCDKQIPLEELKSDDEFRTHIFSRFSDILAGNIGSAIDPQDVKRVLRVLSLVQPIFNDDKSVDELIHSLECLSTQEYRRIFKLLYDSGILFKRGGKYRLSPDMLADYIIEEACVGVENQSTGYAEKALGLINTSLSENILCNVGKLDRRISSDGKVDTCILNNIWQFIQSSEEKLQNYASSIKAVAYYQPKVALDYVERCIRLKLKISELPEIANLSAYNYEFVPMACECLWELGKNEDSSLNQKPSHGIRLLSELCEVAPDKPVAYSRLTVDFALSLIERPHEWKHNFTPLDILSGAMKTDVHVTTSKGFEVSFSKFDVNYPAVSAIRNIVISKVLTLLDNDSLKIAILSAQFLSEAIRGPMHVSNSEWEGEFVDTLNKIEKRIKNININDLVLIELARSISWHANFTSGTTHTIAKRIIDLLPTSLTFKSKLSLIDGYGDIFDRRTARLNNSEWEIQIRQTCAKLLEQDNSAEYAFNLIISIFNEINSVQGLISVSPYRFFDELLRNSDKFAILSTTYAREKPNSKIAGFAGSSLSWVYKNNHEEAKVFIKDFIKSNTSLLQSAVCQAISTHFAYAKEYSNYELSILKNLTLSDDEWVLKAVIDAVRQLATIEPNQALLILETINLDKCASVTDNVMSLFGRGGIPFELLTKSDVEGILDRTSGLLELNGYWIETFLANCSLSFPLPTANFFIKRVEKACEESNWQFRPCNHGPYGHEPLKFRESPESDLIIEKFLKWLTNYKYKDTLFSRRSAQLFESMFAPFDNKIIHHIRHVSQQNSDNYYSSVTSLLTEVGREFVFKQFEFVEWYLERTQALSNELHSKAESALYGATAYGSRSGVPGHPFPEDLSIKQKSEEILSNLSRFSAAFTLYDNLKRHADSEISRSLKEAELYED